jgi:hypothetical protein
MAIGTGAAMLGSAVLGGIGSASSSRSQRKAQEKQNALDAAERAKDREHEKQMFALQRKPYEDLAAKWKARIPGGIASSATGGQQ